MKIFAQSNNVVRADPIHNRRDSSAVVRILNSGGLILFLDFYGNGIFWKIVLVQLNEYETAP